MTDRMLITALQYLKYGWSVFPCKSDKTPFVKWEPYQERRPTEDEIRGWWEKYPSANIAIITGKISGLTVIDVDSEEGDTVLAELLPDGFETVWASTASGGFHYYCKYAEGTRNATRWITDCDIRSEGGYVVAPPSVGEKGKWEWVNGPEDPMAPVPQSVLIKLSREITPTNTPAGPPPRALSFSEGTRDEDIYHVAHCLVRGNMPEEEIRVITTILANQCKPPFPIKDAMKKVQSALNNQGRQKGEIIDLFREWLEGDVGTFSLKDAYPDLGIVDRRGRQALSNTAARLVKEGILDKTGRKGQYRIRDRETVPIDFLSASDEEVPILWPLGVNRYFRLLPKNICVLAGEQDSGKTAYLLALAHQNLRNHEIHYFSSEMGPEEFKNRLKGFQPETSLGDWKKYDFFPHERDSNFADVIKPNAINIVDYLEVDGSEGREFWRVGGMLKDIRDRLNKGVAIVAIQKNPDKKKDHHNLGRGGYLGLEKPRLYMSITKYPNTLRLEKVKNWRNEDYNPNGLQVRFKLVRGCRFQIQGDWAHKIF